VVDAPKPLAGTFVGSRFVDCLNDANRGIAMAPLPLFVMGGTLVGTIIFAFMVDIVKVSVFKRLRLA